MSELTTSVLQVHATAQATVDLARRRIKGIAVPWGVVGYTNVGATIFTEGSLRVPADSRNVKLLVQHDGDDVAVGYLVGYGSDRSNMTAEFYLPPGAAGDAALAAAKDRLREGLSVGATITAHHLDMDGNLVVDQADLYEVSLVTIPAFSDARVLEIAAQRKDPLAMPPEAPAAPVVETPTEPAPQSPPAESAPPAAQQAAPTVQASHEPQAAPIVPASTKGRVLNIRAAAALVADGIRNGADPFQLVAALNDVIPADDAGKASFRDQWAGKLWQASRAARPFIDALGASRDITSLTVLGWKYDLANTAKVAPYAGNKTAIPSGPIKTVPATATAQRLAGGWDVDRAYIDLGDPNFVEDIFQQATDSYRLQTEAAVRTVLVAAATALPASGSLTAALSAIGSSAGQIGSEVSLIAFASDVWDDFTAMTSDEAPWWLRSQGAVNLGTSSGSAGGLTFVVAPELAAGTVVGLDGRAATFYEKYPPIRATALNIPNGGVDLGVFGYYALIVNDPRAIVKTTVTAPAGLAAKSK